MNLGQLLIFRKLERPIGNRGVNDFDPLELCAFAYTYLMYKPSLIIMQCVMPFLHINNETETKVILG